MINTIDINGVKYIPREEKKVQPQGKFTPRVLFPMVTSGLFTDSIMPSTPYMGDNMPEKKREQPQIEIIKEYGLIQLKKSNLSRKKRAWVVWAFERQYRKVD